MKTYRDIAGDGGSNVAAQVEDQLDRMRARLKSVRHIVAVASGKGGVGKSTLTLNLAHALVRRGRAVGILDADINGASIRRMTGGGAARMSAEKAGIVPPTTAFGVKVMSIDLFLQDDGAPVVWDAPTQQDAYTWRAMMEMGAIREFLADTDWGALDFLLIDLPPGTDKLPNVVGLLPRLSGTVIVTIPTDVSKFVVGKSIRMAQEVLHTPVIGVVENMSAHVCASCGHEQPLFPGGRVELLAAQNDVAYLGSVPLDPRIAAATATESPFMERYADSPAGLAIDRLARLVEAYVARSAESPAPVPARSPGGEE